MKSNRFNIFRENHIRSIRQEKLSQDARDIIAYAFSIGVPANDLIPMPMNAVEVLAGDGDVNRILNGGDGFRKHGGVESLRYFNHADDDDWAIVFAHDCDGNAERGKAYMADLQCA